WHLCIKKHPRQECAPPKLATSARQFFPRATLSKGFFLDAPGDHLDLQTYLGKLVSPTAFLSAYNIYDLHVSKTEPTGATLYAFLFDQSPLEAQFALG
ncbi:MAG: hypothetical protein OTJ44_06005, partial [Planctomycetota bacterium]|nr:hypothetical protein [Planctomycetota bacterium]